MLQQVNAVITAKFSLHCIFVPDVGIFSVADKGILIHIGMVGHVDVRLEELRGELAIDFCGYPAFTEIEVQIGKGNGRWCGGTQGSQTLFRFLMLRMIPKPRLDTLRLFNHVA